MPRLCNFCAWFGGLTKTLKAKLQVSQNKLVRLTLGLAPRAHVGKEHFQELGWLPLKARKKQLMLGIVHNITTNRAPEYFSNYLPRRGDAHAHNTRASIADLCLPRFRTKTGKRSFKRCGAKYWNALPPNFKALENRLTFKKNVKTLFLNQVKE